MSILIEESDKGYIIAVREWAELQLGRPIKHLYNTKSNAVRAVRDRSRNTVTLLCQLAWENARRAAQLELILRCVIILPPYQPATLVFQQ